LRPEGGTEDNSHVQLMGGNVGFDVIMIKEFGLVVKFTEEGGGFIVQVNVGHWGVRFSVTFPQSQV